MRAIVSASAVSKTTVLKGAFRFRFDIITLPQLDAIAIAEECVTTEPPPVLTLLKHLGAFAASRALRVKLKGSEASTMLGWQSIDSDTKLFIFGEATD
jgi:hypothetical protein